MHLSSRFIPRTKSPAGKSYGLAKAIESKAASTDSSDSPTISQMATKPGILLGTPAYMSPEQAAGKTVERIVVRYLRVSGLQIPMHNSAVEALHIAKQICEALEYAHDRRADIRAFGCVLYEMLTGKKAFRGESVADTLAAVLRAEPDWSLLPAGTPNRVRVLLQRCLQKDPKQRLQSIGDARIAIDEFLSGALGPTAAVSHYRHRPRRYGPALDPPARHA